ncbi:hypothetical protein F4777DRAFT_553684 [Nemania sp. FL0916]|nr:hypothetical protein F4777DRAFT_553684 [Nemania sp. FL0916]
MSFRQYKVSPSDPTPESTPEPEQRRSQFMHIPTIDDILGIAFMSTMVLSYLRGLWELCSHMVFWPGVLISCPLEDITMTPEQCLELLDRHYLPMTWGLWVIAVILTYMGYETGDLDPALLFFFFFWGLGIYLVWALQCLSNLH